MPTDLSERIGRQIAGLAASTLVGQVGKEVDRDGGATCRENGPKGGRSPPYSDARDGAMAAGLAVTADRGAEFCCGFRGRGDWRRRWQGVVRDDRAKCGIDGRVKCRAAEGSRAA